VNLANETFDSYSGRKVSAVAGLIAVASFSGAEAQQSNLPPVTVDAPVERPRPAMSKPAPDQIRARNALRRATRRSQPAWETCLAACALGAAPTSPSSTPGREPTTVR